MCFSGVTVGSETPEGYDLLAAEKSQSEKLFFIYLYIFCSINEAISFCFCAVSFQHNRLKTVKWARKSRVHS